MMRPLAIDLFCGLGGFTAGLLAEGWDVVGFDVERHVYGDEKYPAQLVLQDVLTIHGSQFKGADLIVASPPCQEYSYMAMPWSRAKGIAAEYRSSRRDKRKLTALFDACFRIQREASEAAGRHIPMVVENVRGAQPWVGRARANYGSFYLWGDVPILLPKPHKARKVPSIRDEIMATEGLKLGNAGGRTDQTRMGSDWRMQAARAERARRDGHSRTRHLTNQAEHDAVKADGTPGSISRTHGSKYSARKAASARIAKIPERLSRWIARYYMPERSA